MVEKIVEKNRSLATFCQCVDYLNEKDAQCDRCRCSYGCKNKTSTICLSCEACYCVSHGLTMLQEYGGETLNYPYNCIHEGEVIKAIFINQCLYCQDLDKLINVRNQYKIDSVKDWEVKNKALSMLQLSERDMKSIICGLTKIEDYPQLQHYQNSSNSKKRSFDQLYS